jgi:hypothetical protein
LRIPLRGRPGPRPAGEPNDPEMSSDVLGCFRMFWDVLGSVLLRLRYGKRKRPRNPKTSENIRKHPRTSGNIPRLFGSPTGRGRVDSEE